MFPATQKVVKKVYYYLMKIATKFLFDLGKITGPTLFQLIIDSKIPVFYSEDDARRIERQLDTRAVKPTDMIELTPIRSVRVKQEIWHKGEPIIRTAAELVDLLTEDK